MAEYKQPKTRIKVVEDGWGIRYYPQYLIVLIPFILGEWHPIYEELENTEYVPTMGEARGRVDRFLQRRKHHWISDIERKARMKVKKNVSVIKYP